MIQLLKSFLSPPRFDDPEKARLARTIRILLFFLLFHIPLLPILDHLQEPERRLSNEFLIANTLTHLVVLFGLILTLRRGHVLWTARALAIWVWLVIASIVIAQGGIDTAFFSVFALVIIVNGLLTGRRGTILTTAASLTLGGAIWVAGMDERGLDSYPGHENVFWLVSMAEFVIAGTFTFLMVNGLIHAWQDARLSAWQAEDTSQRLKVVREERIRLQQQLEAFFDHTLDIIAVSKTSGELIMVNPAVERVLGYSREEFISIATQDLINLDDLQDLASEFSQLLNGGALENVTFRIRHKDGHYRWFSSTLFMFENQVFGIGRDVTEAKEHEAERITFEADRKVLDMRRDFITQISHEFRTPLTVIRSSYELLERYGERMSPEDRQRRSEKIYKHIELMTEMVDLILLINQFNTGAVQLEPEPLDIEDFCREMIDSVQNDSGSLVNIDFANRSTVTSPQLDPNLVRCILTNLLSNAIKYSTDDGEIKVEVEDDETTGCIILHVKDNGIGMNEAFLPHLFRPFSRAKNAEFKQGAGLGMTAVQRAVEVHRGRIDVESAEGRGTTFTVRLPATPTNDCRNVEATTPAAEPSQLR